MPADFDAAKLAAAYKRLVLWFGAQLLLTVVSLPRMVRGGARPPSLLDTVLSLAGWALLLALVYYAYRTASALGSSVAWLWAVAMVFPLVNIVTLLILSAKATRACRSHGVPVGFLGPKIPAREERHSIEP